MSEALGRPPLVFADLRPFGPPMIIVRSHEVAEQISKASKLFPYGLPKMPQVYGHMVHVTGPTSILAAHVRSRNISLPVLLGAPAVPNRYSIFRRVKIGNCFVSVSTLALHLNT
jgi:hypothetical protein